VRIWASANHTLSHDEGRFVQAALEAGVPVAVSAWKAGYDCASQEQVKPPADDVILRLRLVQTNDYPDSSWIPPPAISPATRASPA